MPTYFGFQDFEGSIELREANRERYPNQEKEEEELQDI